jgi:hypothetical protein
MLDRLLKWARIDFAPDHRPPEWRRVALATVLALALSLLADAALVAIGTKVFPATKGYAHFQFQDYAKLTIVGVLIACAAWPVVARICAAPRALFFHLAIVVTVVLLLPDLYIWKQGQPGEAVAVLVAMHLAIALITYNLLVQVAPVRPVRRPASEHQPVGPTLGVLLPASDRFGARAALSPSDSAPNESGSGAALSERSSGDLRS